MIRFKVPVPPSAPATEIREAARAADAIGYPVMVRVSFNLGGGGSFVAWTSEELSEQLRRAFAQSEVGEVLVERYLYHWKELEFEVVRDAYGNLAAVACMENADPMGVHTGDSVVVAPCQTLNDYEYQLLRAASFRVAEAIELVGEANVQLALNPRNSDDYYVIETNPRMSRSSALASKATGYPLAYIAAKLALGYRLHELLNKVTGKTCACFEPSLDYVVVKVPRWDLEKFEGVERSIGTEMKSIGEVMAIGRNFAEALQKAIRMLDIGEPGLTAGPTYESEVSLCEVLEKLRRREPYWPLWAAKALRHGATVEELHELAGIDPYFLYQVREVVEVTEGLRRAKPGTREFNELLCEAKRLGFSDEQVAFLTGLSVDEARRYREELDLKPIVKQIDTLAAEWPAETNYLYMTYDGSEHDVSPLSKAKVVVLGAGVFRIGVSVEFDWVVVDYAHAARERGYEVVVVNYNPETVSTDWDINEKLYFEEITPERVLDVYEIERPVGVVAFLGGQLANNIAWELERRRVVLIGTRGKSVDVAENRAKFNRLLDKLGLKQPPWIEASSVREVVRFADDVSYPVLVRPSYVLGGSAMSIAWNEEELVTYLTRAARISPKHPVVVSKFMAGAIELEVDAVGDGVSAVGTVIEHIEPAGVHSGDSTMTIPPYGLPKHVVRRVVDVAQLINSELSIRGPFNVQFLYDGREVYVIELNLRASRSMPFTSKTLGYNLMVAAAEASLEGRLRSVERLGEFNLLKPRACGVKSPQFSWARLRGAYPFLAPEMRSTGEVAAFGWCLEEALLKSWLSVRENKLPDRERELILAYSPVEYEREYLSAAATLLSELGYAVRTVESMEVGGVDALSSEGARGAVVSGKVGLLLTTGYAPQRDYALRRAAADMNVPLVLSGKLALFLAEALKWIHGGGELEVRDMREYWPLSSELVLR